MKILLSLYLLISTISYSFSQSQGFRINNYSPKDYGTGREATNNACVQDKNGVFYFGNAGGLLQYDGSSWSFIPVKNQSLWIKALAVGDDNTVYAGAQGEFGYLEPDESGTLGYVSLHDQLTERIFLSDIVRLWASNNKVIFQYEEALFIYSDGVLRSVLPETSFHISFLINDELFIRQRGIGIMKLTDDGLKLVKGTEFMKDFGIFSMLESSDRKNYLVITHEDGFWAVDKDTFRSSRITTNDSSTFRQSEIYGALKLNDGNIAIYTLANGILITDENFKIKLTINKNNGLKVNSVNSLMQDYQGNLWACLDNGIDQIHYSSPVSFYGAEAGISGNIKAIIRYNEDLFIGTTDGLFTLNKSQKLLSALFIPFGGISKEVRSFCLAEGNLLIITGDELYVLENRQIRKIENLEINSLYYSERLKILFISAKKKFYLYKYSGNWNKIGEIPEITEDIIRFAGSDNPEMITLWMGTRINGIVRLQISDPYKYEVDKYDSADGLTSGTWALPFTINNKIFFAQSNGLLSFVDEKVIKAQLPDSLKEKPEFYKGYFEFAEFEGSKHIFGKPLYLVENTGERVYVYLDGDLGYFDKRNDYSFVKNPFALAYIGKINVILHENNDICWIGGDDGLMRFNEKDSKDYNVDFTTLITRITCGADSVIFYGFGPDMSYRSKNKSIRSRQKIEYNLNTVTFDFTAPFYEGQEKLDYSYKLIGQDTAYSQWSRDNRIVFSNLREGDYTFYVRARNAYGHISNEQDFSFTILAPWYRTTWAILLYLILISAFFYAGILIYTRRLVALNKKLEKTIEERTHEIHDKNIVLESQKKEILDSINYAHRIQNAVLPNEVLMKDYLGDHFIILRPKDIVSGDFYWTKIINQFTVFCVADCTGHGVPGAFMSMLCISFLDEVILKERIFHPETVLNRVRKMVIASLRQKGLMWEQKDGMDISLCFYNRETSVIEFAGANNPVYIVREKDSEPLPYPRQLENERYTLYEIKGDRMPVSFNDQMEPFTRNLVKVQKNDRLYLFSDGISDQFGGPNGKRFMYNSLRTALLETITPEIRNQKVLIEARIDEWQAYINPKTGGCNEQVDDMCLLGIKI